MDLFAVMLVKSVVLLAWAGVSEYFWPEKSLDEERSSYRATQRLPRLPAPK